jgi:hypothetical protein
MRIISTVYRFEKDLYNKPGPDIAISKKSGKNDLINLFSCPPPPPGIFLSHILTFNPIANRNL